MSGSRILVVEDEPIVAKDIQKRLQAMGYDVPVLVSSGEDAIARAGQYAPDLVLMDIMLKGEMDGIQAAERIRSELRIPVVYLTAYTDDNTLKRAKISEAFGYLLKPFEERELQITIEMALYKHKMERRLRESRQRMEITLRCLGDAVVATDVDGRIEFMNPAAERMLGWDAASAIGKNISEVFKPTLPSGSACLDAIVDPVKAGHRVDIESDVYVATQSGGMIVAEVSASPITDERGGMVGMVLVCRDVTERREAARREKELQEKLSRSKRIESVGTLAAGIAHDLNNILGPIVGYPDLIIKNLPPDSPVREDLDIIKNSARKAVTIIRDLLTLGRTGHYSMAPVNLNQILAACMRSSTFLMLKEKNPLVMVELRLDDSLPLVMGSEQHLFQAILNLLTNAFEAVAGGGRVTVTSRARIVVDEGTGHFEVVAKGEYATIEVSDSGPGLAEDDIARVFEPFRGWSQSSTASGAGLGMAVVYGVVKDHKGFVDVISSEQGGTTVTAFFPVTQSPAPAVRKDAQVVGGTETILIVDDDEEQRRFAVRLLGSLGYRVLEAANGTEAVRLFMPGSGAPAVDLALIDMIMADDIDGLETYRRILALKPGQKAIVVSGFSLTSQIKEALALGAGQFIQKPFTIEELGKAVRRELDKGTKV